MIRIFLITLLLACLTLFYQLSANLSRANLELAWLNQGVTSLKKNLSTHDISIITLSAFTDNSQEAYLELLNTLNQVSKTNPASIHLVSPLSISDSQNIRSSLEKKLVKLPKTLRTTATLKPILKEIETKNQRLAVIRELSALMNSLNLNLSYSEAYLEGFPQSRYLSPRFKPFKLNIKLDTAKYKDLSIPLQTNDLPIIDLNYLRTISSKALLNFVPEFDSPYLLFEYDGQIVSHFALSLLSNYYAIDTETYQFELGKKNRINQQTFNLSSDGKLYRLYHHSFSIVTPTELALDELALESEQHIVIGHENDPTLDQVLNTFYTLISANNPYVPHWHSQFLLFAYIAIGLFIAFLQPFIKAQLGVLLAFIVSLGLVALQAILYLNSDVWINAHYPALSLTLVSLIHGIFLQQRGNKKVAKEQMHMAWLTVARQQLSNDLQLAYDAIKMCATYKPARKTLMEIAARLEKKAALEQALDLYRSAASKDTLGNTTIKHKIALLESKLEQGNKLNKTVKISSIKQHLPFSQLGRYKIERVIGQGASSVVYLGSDPKIGRQVAVKTYHLNTLLAAEEQEEAKLRFHREAETAGQLRHANIVTIYDVDEDQNHLFIAMDYVPGINLSSLIKSQIQLSTLLVYQITLQIAQALKYAHAHGVVHRDIKPANILYEEDRQHVTVMDFGIALVVDNSRTRTGTILGSPYYMSPEQIKGEKVDARSDVFSLGVTFFQLMTLRLPFDGDALASLSYNIVNKKHKSIRKIRSDLPKSAATIINLALNKDKNTRCAIEVLIELLEKEISRLN